MNTPRKLIFSTALILSMTALSAPAAVMVFTHSGTGSGSLNGVPFSNVAFVITGRGDLPLNFSGGRSTEHDSASIALQGLGTFDFVSATRTFVNNTFNIVGFSRGGSGGIDLLSGPNSSVFTTWDMQTDIAQVSGSGNLLQWSSSPVTTTGGVLFFTNSSPTVSFSATAVPEPTGTVLLCCGASLLLMRRQRRL